MRAIAAFRKVGRPLEHYTIEAVSDLMLGPRPSKARFANGPPLWPERFVGILEATVLGGRSQRVHQEKEKIPLKKEISVTQILAAQTVFTSSLSKGLCIRDGFGWLVQRTLHTGLLGNVASTR